MSFISSIKNLFQPVKRQKIKTEIDKIFDLTASMTKSVDVVENYLSQHNKLKRREKNGFNVGYIKLYLSWEEFIINSQPTTGKRMGKEEFRRFISRNVNISEINESMRILFVPEREMIIHIYERFIQHFSEYVISNLGNNNFLKIAKESNPGSVFDNLKIGKKGFDFSNLNKVILPNKRDFHVGEITRIFKGFVAVFYNKIELSLGARIAHGIFNKFFTDLQETYDTDIAAILLRVTPERVLNLDEWLSLLSKTELEREVKSKTSELNDLNTSLEQKVNERTQELQKAYEELKKLDNKKSEFISVAAHQLRTPLSGIKWTIEMLIKGELGPLNDDQKKFLEKTYKTNENLIIIINDMLSSDLIIKGKESYVCGNTNIYNIMDEAVFQVESMARTKNIKIIKSERIKNIENIIADKRKIYMVMINLVDNAVKYGTRDSEIKIDISDNNDSVKVCVSDQGIGIPKDQQEGIFDKFFRADNAVRTQANGSGLGLFISKNIIERHGGKIWFEENKPRGTKLCFTLPKKPVNPVTMESELGKEL